MLSQLPRFSFFPPKRLYVEDKLALKNLIEYSNGIRACYITPYVYPTRETFIVDCIINDFDTNSPLQLEKPYSDGLKLKHFCEEVGLDFIIDFSGKKGYHILPGVKSITVHNEEEKLKVKEELATVQLSLERYLDLKTLDHKVIGDTSRVLRIPTTLHVDKQGVRNGLYCRNILPEEFERGVHYTLQLAKEPGMIPTKPKQNLTLSQILEYIPKQYHVSRKYYKGIYPTIISGGSHVPNLPDITCPCMIKALQQVHPPHDARREITCWLKLCSYSHPVIVEFYHRVNWRNFNFPDTEANVKSINARPPDCNYMKATYGVECCEKCPLSKW